MKSLQITKDYAQRLGQAAVSFLAILIAWPLMFPFILFWAIVRPITERKFLWEF